jgi:hypothetical protein
MPLLADIQKGLDPSWCRTMTKTSGEEAMDHLGPCEYLNRVISKSSKSPVVISTLPISEICGPVIATQCLEAIYNRDTKSWSCSKRGDKCLVPGEQQGACSQHPECSGCTAYPLCRSPALKTWVEEFGLGPTLVDATPDGEPIWPKVEPEPGPPPLTLSSDAPTILMYLGLGVLGVLLLTRR